MSLAEVWIEGLVSHYKQSARHKTQGGFSTCPAAGFSHSGENVLKDTIMLYSAVYFLKSCV